MNPLNKRWFAYLWSLVSFFEISLQFNYSIIQLIILFRSLGFFPLNLRAILLNKVGLLAAFSRLSKFQFDRAS